MKKAWGFVGDFYFARGSDCKVLLWLCVCVYVCLSVCEDISGTTHAIFTKFLVHVAHGCGSVMAGWRNSKGKGQFSGFSSHWQCIVQYGIWDSYKYGWPDRDVIWVSRLGPKNSVLHGSDDPQGGRGNFLWKMFPAGLTPLWIVNWTGPCSDVYTTGSDAWLQALDVSIIGCEGGWYCTPQVKSDIYDCLVPVWDQCFQYLQCFDTVVWVAWGHLAHKNLCHFIPKDSLPEQMEEGNCGGGRGISNPGSPGKQILKCRWWWLMSLTSECSLNVHCKLMNREYCWYVCRVDVDQWSSLISSLLQQSRDACMWMVEFLATDGNSCIK